MMWFIDCGAHRGESIRFARRLYGSSVRAIAVEPIAEYGANLSAERAIVIPAALATKIGTAALYVATSEVSSSLIADKITGGLSPDRSRTVPTTTLGTILSALPQDRVVVKIDIEGMEYAVLEQALNRCELTGVVDLFVDFHGDRIPSISRERHNALVERLLAAGYTLPKWSPVEGRIESRGAKWLLS